MIESVRPRRRRPLWVAGDRGYSYRHIREKLERRGIVDAIPQRSDQKRRDGRRRLDRTIYRERNVVERCVGWLKENRRIGTRFEKLATTFLAMVQLAFLRRYLAALDPSNTA